MDKQEVLKNLETLPEMLKYVCSSLLTNKQSSFVAISNFHHSFFSDKPNELEGVYFEMELKVYTEIFDSGELTWAFDTCLNDYYSLFEGFGITKEGTLIEKGNYEDSSLGLPLKIDYDLGTQSFNVIFASDIQDLS